MIFRPDGEILRSRRVRGRNSFRSRYRSAGRGSRDLDGSEGETTTRIDPTVEKMVARSHPYLAIYRPIRDNVNARFFNPLRALIRLSGRPDSVTSWTLLVGRGSTVWIIARIIHYRSVISSSSGDRLSSNAILRKPLKMQERKNIPGVFREYSSRGILSRRCLRDVRSKHSF